MLALRVARIANPERPEELLDDIVDHLVVNGVGELSLRPLAKAVGSSPRVLLYYFGSKEDLVVKALARLRERQRSSYERMKATKFASSEDACRAIWKSMSAPQSQPLFRMFFEAYAMALRHPRRFSEFLRTAIEDWLEFVVSPLMERGCPEPEARAYATVVVAGFRGFMLDYCASGDRARVDRAVEMWLKALNAIPMK
jgi:AcrR family transcriptional regulator